MGDFRIQIEGVGNHGCQRDVQNGEVKADECNYSGCVDCIARSTVKALQSSGASITSATLMHWPQNGPQIVDDLKTGKRTGAFGPK